MRLFDVSAQRLVYYKHLLVLFTNGGPYSFFATFMKSVRSIVYMVICFLYR